MRIRITGGKSAVLRILNSKIRRPYRDFLYLSGCTDKMSHRQNVPQTKHPRVQNVLQDKTSSFCFSNREKFTKWKYVCVNFEVFSLKKTSPQSANCFFAFYLSSVKDLIALDKIRLGVMRFAILNFSTNQVEFFLLLIFKIGLCFLYPTELEICRIWFTTSDCGSVKKAPTLSFWTFCLTAPVYFYRGGGGGY